jgi:probable rRNA maturation factor
MSPAKQQPDTVVQIAKNFKGVDVPLSKLKKLVKTILESRRVSGAVVSIAIVGDAEIRKMNKRFLKRNRTTDVVSFDLSDSNRKLFELVVNGEMAVRQAKRRGHSDEAELALYVTHGLLHNLGFDDTTQTRAKKMHEEEDKILREFGYGSVYNT